MLMKKLSSVVSRQNLEIALMRLFRLGRCLSLLCVKWLINLSCSLRCSLQDRQVEIELSPQACDWLADKGYDAAYGARPLSRVVQEHIKKPLAEMMLLEIW